MSESKIENGRPYSFEVDGHIYGAFFRTGERGDRTYHVFNGDGDEIGHVRRYRYVAAMMDTLLHDHIRGLVEKVEVDQAFQDQMSMFDQPSAPDPEIRWS